MTSELQEHFSILLEGHPKALIWTCSLLSEDDPTLLHRALGLTAPRWGLSKQVCFSCRITVMLKNDAAAEQRLSTCWIKSDGAAFMVPSIMAKCSTPLTETCLTDL